MEGEHKLSRRTFCQVALAGGALLGLATSRSIATYAQGAQEDEDIFADDPEDFAAFLTTGTETMEDLEDLSPDDRPELIDPRVDDDANILVPGFDDHRVYLPLIHTGNGATAAQAGMSATSGEVAAKARMSNRERALTEAIKRLGYHEVAVGGRYNNLNKFSGYFEYLADNKRGVIRNVRRRWCADFASWAFDLTGNNDGKVPWGNPASVLSIKQWAERHRLIYTSPQRGDIFVMRGFWRGKWRSHCGIVRKIERERGTFLAVEGNTSRTLSKQKSGAPPYREVIWVAHQRRKINELTTNGQRLYHFVRVPSNPPR